MRATLNFPSGPEQRVLTPGNASSHDFNFLRLALRVGLR
jgi:hypothetical protein